ncbi:3'(2'),5'-bisphosphate nucleotidase CysQ [Abyssalbus ytuae]|uniref:3'(2'),5'-bisphosphate nucleotidase CysQ n=1 Tax=Abyssalbus ytuae TaxID=2926907 RepID=A0A9E6ZKT1_9FLAO|nr:3'(2'),5'-bisphosphate nucleotidase CysQ [Abyssalbus ytuae]UOB16040.1 3'(2'),5'-bisphosphate nucleotidase CysQ [Abyssalbus ytuae]
MKKLLEKAIQTAILAGEEILKIYNSPDSDFSVEKKTDNSPLTIADKISHKIIEIELSKTGLPVLSEEGNNIPFKNRKEWYSFWLIDPLDGTKEFLKRNGEFTVNIALIRKNKPRLGVIYVPVSKTLYFGSKEITSRKTTIDNKSINIETLIKNAFKLPVKENTEHNIVVVSRSHTNKKTLDFIKKLEKKNSKTTRVFKGSSLKICLVAEGIANIYPRFGPTMEWDTAAGHAIAKFAGKNLFLAEDKKELEYNKESLLNPHFIAM